MKTHLSSRRPKQSRKTPISSLPPLSWVVEQSSPDYQRTRSADMVSLRSKAALPTGTPAPLCPPQPLFSNPRTPTLPLTHGLYPPTPPKILDDIMTGFVDSCQLKNQHPVWCQQNGPYWLLFLAPYQISCHPESDKIGCANYMGSTAECRWKTIKLELFIFCLGIMKI